MTQEEAYRLKKSIEFKRLKEYIFGIQINDCDSLYDSDTEANKSAFNKGQLSVFKLIDSLSETQPIQTDLNEDHILTEEQ